MSCKFKDECPSYSGWCDGPKQYYSECVGFLINAYKRVKNETAHSGSMIKSDVLPDELRAVVITCVVNGGSSTVISHYYTGEQIAKIESMLKEIMSWHPETSIKH